MRILVACECSGRVREALRRAGHDAWSCDLKPAEDGSLFHFQGDMFAFTEGNTFRALIAHPDCTYLCSSGLHWNTRGKVEADGRLRSEHTEDAVRFVQRILALPIEFKAIENPIGCLSTRIRKPDQIIQPHEFGDDASKGTCLWLEGLPLLRPTRHVAPRIVNGKKRWANQTDSGQNRLGPSEERAAERARTYQGIADAIGTQWGRYLEAVEWAETFTV